MLNSRYHYDGQPILKLNALQQIIKDKVESKVKNNIYKFETVPCCICKGNEFELLSEKDRYGLYVPISICKECGLIQTNPRMSQQSYNTFYKSEYRKLYVGTETPTQNFFKQQYFRGVNIFHYLKRHGAFSEIKSIPFIFEVGCGAGGILKYFQDMGCRVKGIDLDEEYINFGKKNHGLDLSVGVISETQLDISPDIIIYCHVLEHILQPLQELKNVYNKLGKAGIIYIEVPGIKNLLYSNEMDFLRYLQNAHTYHFTLTTLNNLLKANGFRLKKGDERIKSIYCKGSVSTNYVSDYHESMRFLQKIERARSRYYYQYYYKIKSVPFALFKKLLKLLGLHKTAKKIFYSLKSYYLSKKLH